MAEIMKEDVVKFIENMTVLELANLIKELEDKFGVSAAAVAAPMAAAMPGAAAPAGSGLRCVALPRGFPPLLPAPPAPALSILPDFPAIHQARAPIPLDCSSVPRPSA